MAVFRIEKNKDYTVMSNFHLKDKRLSLKAKGMLSMMLSLPNEWDYSVRGLASICKEGVDCIGGVLRELEAAGYIQRNRLRNERGKIVDTEYVIYESPQEDDIQRSDISDNETLRTDAPCTDAPGTENPGTENPCTENPYTDKPCTEKPAQLNTKELNTKELNTYPIKSYHETSSVGYDEIKGYEELIKKNIDYENLSIKLKDDINMLDEIVGLITDTVCSSKEYIIISGDRFPKETVKSRLLKINGEHIEYVIDCMKENSSKIRNIKKYLMAAIFNAPLTMDNYYTTKVNYDMSR